MLVGVDPIRDHEWYLAVYVDAVEWVELPNTLGMSQFAVSASGKYIQRMSNNCGNCRYDPAESAAENACPFITLYWDFLMCNEQKLTKVGGMDMQLRNLVRIEAAKKAAITKQANELKESYR